MSVSIEQILPGAVFRFKAAARRITSLGKPAGRGFNVNWEYADGKKRGGRLTGSQWVHYFRSDAIEQIPDPAQAVEMRKLKVPSGRTVTGIADNVTISLTTHCPQKWAIVDMETGQLWGHDGQQFRLLSPDEAQDVAHVANQAARKF